MRQAGSSSTRQGRAGTGQKEKGQGAPQLGTRNTTMPQRGRATRVVCSTSYACAGGRGGGERVAGQSAALERGNEQRRSSSNSSSLCCVLIFGSAFGLHIKTITLFFSAQCERERGKGGGGIGKRGKREQGCAAELCAAVALKAALALALMNCPGRCAALPATACLLNQSSLPSLPLSTSLLPPRFVAQLFT